MVADATKSAETLTANPDGSFTWVSSSAPVRVKRAGGWRDIDTTLRRSGKFVSPRVGGTGVWLARSSAGPVAQIVSHSQAIRESEAGELSVGTGTRGQGPRLAYDVAGKAKVKPPRVSGRTATYSGVWRGVKMKIRADAGGVHSTFISSKGRARFPLTLKALGGLSHKITPSGMISFRGPTGREVGSSGLPLVTGVDGGAESAVFGNARFERVRGSKTRVDLVVPRKVMRSAGGATISVGAGVTLATSHATYVQKSYKTTNFDNAGLIKAGGHPDGPGPVENTVSNALVNFGGVGVLKDKVISSANLELWNWWCGDCGSGHLDAKEINEAWDPKKATWDNRPTHTSVGGSVNDGKGGNGVQHCAAGWLNLPNMKPVVDKWANNPANAHGVKLMPLSDSNQNQYKQFDTINGAHSTHPPKMTITYFSTPNPPSAVSVPSPAHTPHPTVTSVAPGYADGGSMVMQFEVTRNPEAPPTWTDQVPVAPGQSMSRTVSVPLGDGPSWEARARVVVNGSLASTWTGWTTFTVDTNPYVRDLQIIPSLANVPPAGGGDVYTQSITPTLRIHLTETFPDERFTVTFLIFNGADHATPIGRVSTTSISTGWASAVLPAGIIVDRGRYEVQASVVDEDSPTPHTEWGHSFIVDVQAPCKSPTARSGLHASCTDGTSL